MHIWPDMQAHDMYGELVRPHPAASIQRGTAPATYISAKKGGIARVTPRHACVTLRVPAKKVELHAARRVTPVSRSGFL